MRPFVLSLGDPAGIGPEVAAKAWEARKTRNLPPFFAIGDVGSVRKVWDGPIAGVESPDQARAAFDTHFPVWQVADAITSVPGAPTLDGAYCALRALELGVGLARACDVSGLVTAPVSKQQLYEIGFTQPGQTEFIAERCGVSATNAIMMLAGPTMRVVPITVHVPFRNVPDMLTIDLIKARAHATAKGISRNFGIDRPRLALAGLNPHAGEGGTIGREEIDILIPAVQQLCDEDIDIIGPVSPDALFSPHMRATYDAALCLYHDQALIPLKALHFDEGVNMTLGLPIIRTSPDHGTAFPIAGRNLASPGAMIAAIQMAAQCAAIRETADLGCAA